MVFVLFVLQLFVGSVDVLPSDVWSAITGSVVSDQGHWTIVREIRLPQAITALCAGGGLAVSGLLMQTLFRNPLAGPSVLGISSGSSLGVALVLLSHPLWSMSWLPPDVALVVSAWVGAMGVLVLILFADRRAKTGCTSCTKWTISFEVSRFRTKTHLLQRHFIF
jgi:iron complex transport system permease protein